MLEETSLENIEEEFEDDDLNPKEMIFEGY